jgi:hypothetical protein
LQPDNAGSPSVTTLGTFVSARYFGLATSAARKSSMVS